MAACWQGHTDTAKVLVENGSVVDLPNKVKLFAAIDDQLLSSEMCVL